MLITIDSNNITQPDLALLTFLLQNADPTIDTDTVVGPTPGAEIGTDKPKRTRRTKAQIEADRLAEEAAAAPTEEAIEDTEAAENDAEAAAEKLVATIEEVRELASKLIDLDRTKMRAILDGYDARKLTDVPAGQLGELASKISAALPAA